ncbi:MAG: hypothetical protein ACXW3Z_15025, partial [Limisphaerales bacterium]
MNRTALIFLLACFSFCDEDVFAQNVVDDRAQGRTAAAIAITEEHARKCIDRVAQLGGSVKSAEAQRIRRKLNNHVAEFLKGAPWMPFHHTLGISGYEAYFDHSDELFYVLSIATPFLSAENAANAKRHLLQALDRFPPYAVEGFHRRHGAARESYHVPDNLRLSGQGKARSAFGVYGFWATCHYTEAHGLAKTHWAAVQARIEPLLEGDYRFDVQKSDYGRDEAEKLNGDLAGLIGFTRLARINGDMKAEGRGREAVRRLLELRVNLERVNLKISEKTTASKSLHISKLARYCSLMPEVGEAARRWSSGLAAESLQRFRQARNSWHLAFGDRMIGG